MPANRKFITEVLAEINEDPTHITQYKAHTPLRILMQYAFDPAVKFALPEGEPPFKKDAAPLGMSPANFVQEFRRFYIFTPQKELAQPRREALFVQLLENIHPDEAKVLLAVKDQELTKLYKNITLDLLIDNAILPETLREVKGKKNAGSTSRKKS